MSTLREQIARIIDPSSWAVMDSYLAEMMRKYKGADAGYDPDAFKDKASLAKADTILAITNTQMEGLKRALEEIDELEVMEINPSNYDHEDVCELNRNAAYAAVVARDALQTAAVDESAASLHGEAPEAAGSGKGEP